MTSGPSDGQSTVHDLFALTDEQILEIEPEAQDIEVRGPASAPEGSPHTQTDSSTTAPRGSGAPARNDTAGDPARKQIEASKATEHGARNTGYDAKPGLAVPQEPPQWVAEAMNDPQRGREARALWEGAQKAEQEAAAYREVFATPEDARALKTLYPGGVNEARSAGERARTLDEIDAAYFGAAGDSPSQTTAARAQLVVTLLRQDPAAFREMVFEGLKALEGAGAAPLSSGASATATQQFSLADAGRKPALASEPVASSLEGAQHAAAIHSNAPASESQGAAYASFEKAANEELERSVGGAIERTVAQALPNLQRGDRGATVGARTIVPLQDRLGAAIREDVEKALQGDRQLGEQVAQILSARRFDKETRAQVVRLVGERAQQLVPSAARRVINEWTQTTLAAHGEKSGRDAAMRPGIEPAATQNSAAHGNVAQGGSPAQPSARASRSDRDAHPRSAVGVPSKAPGSSRIDYRKLSDEQILDL